ncbi:DUF5977 domain-containing protein [Ornithobacterium rhinotracheale]|uniref:DUF5977 domain-containing protein n=1 Tax=Ornithobacterium rhinotracheale TaxID=28251 RepID=UPI001FF47B42|nr:DUF5977 domain-containing protein [Ornithobacterium rhinotracheale]MCK0204903.1 DUF5977 domain-containing protein [Ornithobacterium rhinotracheale]
MSQADADQKAKAKALEEAKKLVNEGGQAYANTNGKCNANTYTSTQTRSYSRSFTRNNCGSNYYGTSVTYRREATETATSTISQYDADQKAGNAAYAEAQRLVNDYGQAYANSNGSCNYYNPNPPSSGGGGGGGRIYTSTKSHTARKSYKRNNCGVGKYGGDYLVTYTATKTATSRISQDDADLKAIEAAEIAALDFVWGKEAQAEANLFGACIENPWIETVVYKCSDFIKPSWEDKTYTFTGEVYWYLSQSEVDNRCTGIRRDWGFLCRDKEGHTFRVESCTHRRKY